MSAAIVVVATTWTPPSSAAAATAREQRERTNANENHSHQLASCHARHADHAALDASTRWPRWPNTVIGSAARAPPWSRRSGATAAAWTPMSSWQACVAMASGSAWPASIARSRLLSELGVLQRVPVAGGSARYELAGPGGDHHHHLVCDDCGATTRVRGRGARARDRAPQQADRLLRAGTRRDAARDLPGLPVHCAPLSGRVSRSGPWEPLPGEPERACWSSGGARRARAPLCARRTPCRTSTPTPTWTAGAIRLRAGRARGDRVPGAAGAAQAGRGARAGRGRRPLACAQLPADRDLRRAGDRRDAARARPPRSGRLADRPRQLARRAALVRGGGRHRRPASGREGVARPREHRTPSRARAAEPKPRAAAGEPARLSRSSPATSRAARRPPS